MGHSPDRHRPDADGGSSRGVPADDDVAEQAFRHDATPRPWVGPPAARRPGEVTAAAVLLFLSAAFRTLSGLAALVSPTEGILHAVRHLGLATVEVHVGRRLRDGSSAARYGALALAAIGLVETAWVMLAGSWFVRAFALPGLAYSIAIVACVCTRDAREYLRPTRRL
jgi:hypothetical protein